MWAIRVLSGPQAGQAFPLKAGKSKVGRGPSCQIQWTAQGVSKEHAEFSVQGDKISVTDLKSSNGTFLNGVRIQSSFLKLGDKLMVGHTLCDIVAMSDKAVAKANARVLSGHGMSADANGNLPAMYNGNLPQAPSMVPAHMQGMPPMGMGAPGSDHLPGNPPANIFQTQTQKLTDYVDRVALPGVYRLPEVMEFRFVLMGFIGLYIVLLTFLSMVPLYQITSESISTESKRRALTVARSLSEINQKALRSGDYSGFRTDLILREEGIEDAYVISKDGKILAPSERIGLSPREVGFTSKLKGTIREVTDQSAIDGKVAASVPIVAFDSELQQNVAKAYAIVVYNPGNLTFDDGRAFSLFVQMLTLAIVAGILLFFFLYKLIEHPFRLLYKELDTSMREGRDSVNINYHFPALQNLLTSVNSLLSRVAHGGGNDQMQVGKGSRDAEIGNIMQLIGYPSILLTRDEQIARVSAPFEQLTGLTAEKLVNNKVNDIPDPAMQQNFRHLMNSALTNMSAINSDTLEIGGVMFNLNCMAIATASGDIEYFLVTITPIADPSEGAA